MKTVVVGDVGGTNITLAAISLPTYKILNILKEKTQNVSDISILIKRFIKEQNIKAQKCCLAVAGPVQKQYCQLTNANLKINAKDVCKKTKLKCVLINDFLAVAYAINILKKKDLKIINKGTPQVKQGKAVIGAGTGLGKGILYWNKHYHPMASEGGYTDLPVYTKEKPLEEFIKAKRKLSRVYYENVVSGAGIEDIYSFLQETKYHAKNKTAEDISLSYRTDPCSKETLDLFIVIYARACRNFALEALATNGLYIGGGIALKNSALFNATFTNEFINHDVYKELLQNIPVYLITNPNAGLLGAAYALEVNHENLS